MFCWVMPISWLCDIFWLRRDHHSVLSTEEPVSCKCLRLLRWHAIAQFPRKRLLHDCSVKTQTAQMCIPISSPHWSWVLVLCHVADKTCVTLMHDTSTPGSQQMIRPQQASRKLLCLVHSCTCRASALKSFLYMLLQLLHKVHNFGSQPWSTQHERPW